MFICMWADLQFVHHSLSVFTACHHYSTTTATAPVDYFLFNTAVVVVNEGLALLEKNIYSFGRAMNHLFIMMSCS